MRRPTLSAIPAGILTTVLFTALLPSTTTAQTVWAQRSSIGSPVNRSHSTMAFSPVSGRIILFGGSELPPSELGDTWEWAGISWIKRSPKASPKARELHAMATDSLRGRVVVFGGADRLSSTGSQLALLSDTWEWDGSNWIQTTPRTSPTRRSAHAMAVAGGVMILFGGAGTWLSGPLQDTWEYDGKAKTWTEKKPTTKPAARFWHAMTYDSARSRIVMFGGAKSKTSFLGDTWEYDGKDWKLLSPKNNPSARGSHKMVYDAARAKVVLFGGTGISAGQPAYLSDTWEWDGSDWTQVTLTPSPSARGGFAMAYDALRGKVFLFGGSKGTISTQLADTWEYSPTQLTTDTPTVSVSRGGTQTFNLDVGATHAGRGYWLLGSVTGTSPGTPVGSLLVPLNYDFWTGFTLAAANSPLLGSSRGLLDPNGKGQARLNVPYGQSANLIGARLFHSCLVFDTNNFYLASNAVPLTLVK